MQAGARVGKRRLHPWERLKQTVRRFFSGYDPLEGRKNLHGQYPACNWYPATMPEKRSK